MNSHHGLIAKLTILVIGTAAGIASAQNIDFIFPKSGSGPAVILISGVSGTALYQDYANSIAELGYTAALVSGRDISNQPGASADNLRKVVEALRTDSRVKPGKIAVIGFSLGGGGALLHASNQAEVFSAVAAYYPAVSKIQGLSETAKMVNVPTLILAGEKDKFNNCCLIESIREFEGVAKSAGLPVEVHSYPDAEHGFNLKVPAFRAQDAADAWSRVQEFLSKHHKQ